MSDATLLELAVELATTAGRFVRDGRRQGVHDARTKSTATDVATEWDRAAEALLVGELARRRPHDGIVAEEGSAVRGTTGIDWVIDPIDGTTNFVYDLPGYAVSVAATDPSGSLAGAVYVPATDELFAARRGGGATRNGQPIRCATESRLELALVATGFGYRPERRRTQLAVVAHLLPRVRDIRRLGAASTDLCYAACGRVDAYYEVGLSPWDMAAGSLIAAEAGCRLGAVGGGPLRPDSVVAAAPGVYDDLQRLLAEATSRADDVPGTL